MGQEGRGWEERRKWKLWSVGKISEKGLINTKTPHTKDKREAHFKVI